MCLIKKHWLPKVAEEDIVCYKKLYIYNTLYISPVKDYKYEFDDNDQCIITAKFNVLEVIFGGSISYGIHSYNYFKNYGIGSIVYLKAYIPKGTRYYEGKFGEYVSEKLIVYKNI